MHASDPGTELQASAGELEALREHLSQRTGRPGKIVVWAHNTHVGDARGVARDEIADPGQLDIEMKLNGQVMQSSNTRQLIFPVDYLVFPTLLSFQVCVIVVGAAVFAVSAGPQRNIEGWVARMRRAGCVR